MLELGTISRHGNEDIAEAASEELVRLNMDEYLSTDRSDLELDNCNYNTLVRREDHVSRQVMHFTRDTSTTPTATTRVGGALVHQCDKRRRLGGQQGMSSNSRLC